MMAPHTNRWVNDCLKLEIINQIRYFQMMTTKSHRKEEMIHARNQYSQKGFEPQAT
jgi:hypothetical protein